MLARRSAALSSLPKVLGLIVSVVCCLAVSVGVGPASLEPDGSRALAVAATVVSLWAAGTLHPAVTALGGVFLLLAMLPRLGPLALLAGFSEPVLWFLVGVLALGSAVASSGLAHRMARFMVALCKGNSFRLMLQSVAFLPLMTLIVPSALTRNAILIAPYKSVLEHPAFRGSKNLAKAVSLILGMLNPMASSMILTGGIAPALAASLLGGGFTWFRWLVLMAVPYAMVILSGFVLILFLCQFHKGSESALVNKPVWLGHAPDVKIGELLPSDERPGMVSVQEWKVMVALGLACVLWLTDYIHHWNPAAPALLGAVLVLSPWCGTMSWQEFASNVSWSLFVVTGAALCIAHVLESTGACAWLGDVLTMGILRCRVPSYMMVSSTVLVSVLVHAAIPSIPACLALLLPIITGFARQAGLNPLVYGLVALISVDSVALYPEQTATALMVYEQHENLTRSDVLKFGLGMLFATLLVVNFIAVPWWAIFGLVP